MREITEHEVITRLAKTKGIDPLILRPITYGENTHPQFRVERKKKKFVVEPNKKTKLEFTDLDEAVREFNKLKNL